MGAWIETASASSRLPPYKKVAPCMGAWIETSYGEKHYQYLSSHPVWVRGLKRP